MIEIDGDHIQLCQVLESEHDLTTGEMVYTTKPIRWGQRIADLFIRAIRRRKYDRRCGNKLMKVAN